MPLNRVFSIPVLLAVVTCQTAAQASEVVRFRKQASQVGDVSRHVIDCALEADLEISQGDQLVDSSRHGMRRHQDRSLTITALSVGRPTGARMEYHTATKSTTSRDNPPRSQDEPVAGKTYLVTRLATELQITDSGGRVPPPEELAIVQANVQTFGLPNPLADYFAERTVRVGQVLQLPKDIAQHLLGFAGTSGEVNRFAMKLIETPRIDGAACAVFETLVQTTSHEQGHMTLLMKGRLTMQVNTCRTVAVSISGPVAISETRGPPQGRFTVNTSGTLNVAVRARYDGSESKF